jgi:hypothetical protein
VAGPGILAAIADSVHTDSSRSHGRTTNHFLLLVLLLLLLLFLLLLLPLERQRLQPADPVVHAGGLADNNTVSFITSLLCAFRSSPGKQKWKKGRIKEKIEKTEKEESR